MTCLVVVPMLGRPHTVAPLLESLGGTQGVRLLFVCSPDDTDTLAACRASSADVMTYERPGYAAKVNAAYRVTTEPLLFLAACDVRFHSGWLDAARAELGDGIGVVGTNDLGNPRVIRGEHATHSLVTREYADRGLIDGTPGLLFEGYVHEYVDDELIGTAKHRSAWAFAADSHVEHMHPHWGKAPMDDSYAGQEQRMLRSRKLYQRRRRLWT